MSVAGEVIRYSHNPLKSDTELQLGLVMMKHKAFQGSEIQILQGKTWTGIADAQ